jgi:hypothetical protein
MEASSRKAAVAPPPTQDVFGGVRRLSNQACSFCDLMLASPCAKQFVLWENCYEGVNSSAKSSEGNANTQVNDCTALRKSMQACMKEHDLM